MSEKEIVKNFFIEFEYKEDFNTVFTFVWKHLNNQTIKTKGKLTLHQWIELI